MPNKCKVDKLGVIIPILNERRNVYSIITSFNNLIEDLLSFGVSPILIIVDDGSYDGGLMLFEKEIKKNNIQSVLIRFRKNFGKEKAVFAALKEVIADYYVIVDADLQTPMNLIPEMIAIAIHKQVDVVNGVKVNEPYGLIRKTLTYLFYVIAKLMSIKEMKSGYSDFILISQKVRDSLIELKEKEFVLRTMVHWFNFQEESISYFPKQIAASKFSLKKLFIMGIKSLVTFSNFLRINFILTLVYWLSSLIFAIVIVYYKLIGKAVTGLSTILLLLLISFGLLFFMIAIIGEVIKIMFDEIKGRPNYLIENISFLNQKNQYYNNNWDDNESTYADQSAHKGGY